MPALKPSEKRLLWALGGMVFLVANFWGWTVLSDKETAAALQNQRLQAKLKSVNSLYRELPSAKKRDEILGTILRRYDTIDDRDTYLGNLVENAADKFSLNLARQAPMRLEGVDARDDEPKPDFIKSGYTAEISGSYKKLFEFIHEMQNPADFRYFRSLRLTTRKSDSQDGSSEVVCNFELQKWWHPESEKLLARGAQDDNAGSSGGSQPEQGKNPDSAAGAAPGEQNPAPVVKPPEAGAVPAQPSSEVAGAPANPPASGTPPGSTQPPAPQPE